jgi:hypothetical protein
MWLHGNGLAMVGCNWEMINHIMFNAFLTMDQLKQYVSARTARRPQACAQCEGEHALHADVA